MRSKYVLPVAILFVIALLAISSQTAPAIQAADCSGTLAAANCSGELRAERRKPVLNLSKQAISKAKQITTATFKALPRRSANCSGE